MPTEALVPEALVLDPWNGVSYEEALALQREHTAAGRAGWLLFCCGPTITLGRRGHFSDVLMPIDELRRLGVRLLPVDRGGQVTYHGPGQILGFPFGRLGDHVADPRGVRAFVERLQRVLREFISGEAPGAAIVLHGAENNPGAAGLWLEEGGARRKIVSMGLRFGSEGMGHGFALNVAPMRQGFELVNPCGEIGARPASLFPEEPTAAGVREVAARLAGWLPESWTSGRIAP